MSRSSPSTEMPGPPIVGLDYGNVTRVPVSISGRRNHSRPRDSPVQSRDQICRYDVHRSCDHLPPRSFQATLRLSAIAVSKREQHRPPPWCRRTCGRKRNGDVNDDTCHLALCLRPQTLDPPRPVQAVAAEDQDRQRPRPVAAPQARPRSPDQQADGPISAADRQQAGLRFPGGCGYRPVPRRDGRCFAQSRQAVAYVIMYPADNCRNQSCPNCGAIIEIR